MSEALCLSTTSVDVVASLSLDPFISPPTSQAGRTIDTDARRKAMKAKQEADRKKAADAAAKAKALAQKNKVWLFPN